MRRIRTVLVVLLCTFAGAALAAPAAHAATVPTISRAGSVVGDWGTLQIEASSDTDIVQLTARLTSYATGQEVATIDDFELVAGSAQDGTWRTPEPVQLEDLGNYRVDVEARDADGDVATRESAGILTYVVKTKFSSFAIDRPTVTYENRSVTASGTLVGIWPGTREIKPLADFPIAVDAPFRQSTTARTGADGTFATSIPVSWDGEVGVSTRYEYDFRHYLSARAEVPVGVTARETQIKARTDHDTVDQGDTVTVTGQLRWRTEDGWEPMPGTHVGVQVCPWDRCHWTEPAVTDAEGRFSVTFEAYASGPVEAHFIPPWTEFEEPDPFLAAAQAGTYLHVLQPAVFSDFSVSRTPTGQVSVGGHLVFDSASPGEDPVVEIQYRPALRTAWLTVATATAEWDGTGGYGFSGEFEQPAAGQWRAVYAGGDPQDFQEAETDDVFVG